MDDNTLAFYGGMLAALAVVAAYDEQTIYEEIVRLTDKRKLVAAAREQDALEWSGLVKYGYARKRREGKI